MATPEANHAAGLHSWPLMAQDYGGFSSEKENQGTWFDKFDDQESATSDFSINMP